MSDLLLFIFLGITPLIYAAYFLFGPSRIKWSSVFIASIAIGLVLLFVSTALLKPLVLNPLPPGASAEQRVVRIITEERVRSANATSKPLGFTLSVFACMVWNLACYWLCFLTARVVSRSKQLPNQAGPVGATKVMSGVALSTLPLAFLVAFAANSIAKMQRPQVVIASAPDKEETAPTNTSPESPQIESKAPPTSAEPNLPPQLEPVQQTPSVSQPAPQQPRPVSPTQQPTSPSTATDTKPAPVQQHPAATPAASQPGEPIELPSLKLRAITDVSKIFALRTQGLTHNSFNNTYGRSALHKFLDVTNKPGGLGDYFLMQVSRDEREKLKPSFADGDSSGWTRGRPVHCEFVSKSCTFLVYITDYADLDRTMKKRIRQGFWDAAYVAANQEMPPDTDLLVAIFHNEDGELTTDEILFGKYTRPPSPSEPQIVGVGRNDASRRADPRIYRRGTADELLARISCTPFEDLPPLPQQIAKSNASKSVAFDQADTSSLFAEDSAIAKQFRSYNELKHNSFNSHPASLVLGLFEHSLVNNEAMSFIELEHAKYISKHNISAAEVKPWRDSHAIHCQLSEKSCVFLIDMPPFYQFEDEGKERIRYLTWTAANECLQGQLPPGSEIAVAIFGRQDDLVTVNSQEIMLGKVVPIAEANNDPNLLRRYFQGRLPTGVSNGQPDDLLKYFDLKPAAQAAAQSRTRGAVDPKALTTKVQPNASPQMPIEESPPVVQVVEPEITQTFRKLNQLEHNSSNNQKAQSILDTFESRINQPDGPVERVMLEYFRYRSDKGDEAADKFKSWKQNHAIHCQLNADSCAFLIDVPLFGTFYPESQSKLRHEFWHAANDSLQRHLPNGSRLSVAIFHTESDKVITSDVLLGTVTLPFESNTEEPEPTARRYKTFAPKGVTQGKPEDLPPFFK